MACGEYAKYSTLATSTSVNIVVNHCLFLIMKSLAKKRSQLAVPVARFVHVDTTQLEENHEFELSVAEQLKSSSGAKCFKLNLLEHPLQEVCRLIQT